MNLAFISFGAHNLALHFLFTSLFTASFNCLKGSPSCCSPDPLSPPPPDPWDLFPTVSSGVRWASMPCKHATLKQLTFAQSTFRDGFLCLRLSKGSFSPAKHTKHCKHSPIHPLFSSVWGAISPKEHKKRRTCLAFPPQGLFSLSSWLYRPLPDHILGARTSGGRGQRWF